MKLSDNLRRIRKENNLSQEQLAEKLGVSRQAVSKWESGQSYPEMDKVLIICKLFNYNIDELMNENVKEVNENKQSKINFNKYIEDFFEYITKTVNMFSSLNLKQKISCVFEQICISFVLFLVFALLWTIASNTIFGIFGRLPDNVYYTIKGILNSVLGLLGLFIGIVIFLHIFKIRYLDYFESIDVKNENNELDKENTIKDENSNKKAKTEKIEKVIIRDPNHSSSKFLTGVAKIILYSIKIFAAIVAIGFSFLFVGLVTLLILSFTFIKTGVTFIGAFLGIISCIIINYVVLECLYNFIVNRKSNKIKIAILLLVGIILAGVGSGFVIKSIPNFKYEITMNSEDLVQDEYIVEMKEKSYIEGIEDQIEFIETDDTKIRIISNHSKYYKSGIFEDLNGVVHIYCYQDESKIMEIITEIIKEINERKIKNFSSENKILVYTSRENIEKLKENKLKKYEENKEIDVLYEEKNELENRIQELEETIIEKEQLIEERDDEIRQLQIEQND